MSQLRGIVHFIVCAPGCTRMYSPLAQLFRESKRWRFYSEFCSEITEKTAEHLLDKGENLCFGTTPQRYAELQKGILLKWANAYHIETVFYGQPFKKPRGDCE